MRGHMVARVGTVAFQGIEAVPVDVQVMVAPGKMGMSIYELINLNLDVQSFVLHAGKPKRGFILHRTVKG